MKKILSVIKNIGFVILIGLIAYQCYVFYRHFQVYDVYKKEIPNLEKRKEKLEKKTNKLQYETSELARNIFALENKNAILEKSIADSKLELEKLSEYAEGRFVEFGRYKLDGIVQPLRWKVLSKEKGKALLISKYLLDYRIFGEPGTQGYAESSIRKFLNSTFLNAAFTKKEQSRIEKVPIVNGSDDAIFLLSIEEASKYFKYDGDRIAHYSFFEAEGVWWLRDPGPRNYIGAIVDTYGKIYSSLNSTYQNIYRNNEQAYVRPALWVKIEGK